MNKNIEKRKKLDSTHVFLQFLMMFITLCFLIVVASYLVPNMIWSANFKTIISIFSGGLSIIIANLFLYRSLLKKEYKGKFFLLGVLFFILGLFVVVGSRLELLTILNRIILEFPLTFVLLVLFLFLVFKKDWEYDNLTFWGMFSISLFILSKLFLVRSFLFSNLKLVEFSLVVEFFAYVAILIGAVNEIYEALEVTKGAKKAKKK